MLKKYFVKSLDSKLKSTNKLSAIMILFTMITNNPTDANNGLQCCWDPSIRRRKIQYMAEAPLLFTIEGDVYYVYAVYCRELFLYWDVYNRELLTAGSYSQ